MSLEFGQYKVIDQGKMIKDSKRAHMWIIFKDQKKYEIIAKESFVSKKFRFYVQRKLIAEFKTKEENKKRGFDFEANGMYFHIRKTGSAKFTLYIDNVEFKQNNKTNKIAQSNAKQINKALGDFKVKNGFQGQKIKQGTINKKIELNLNNESSGEENFDDFGKKDFGTNFDKNAYGKFDPDSDDDKTINTQYQQKQQLKNDYGFGNFDKQQKKNINEDFGNDFLNFESNNNQQKQGQFGFDNNNNQQFGFDNNAKNNNQQFGFDNNNNQQFGFDNNANNNQQFGFDNNANNNQQFGFDNNVNNNNQQFGFDNNNNQQFGFDNNANNNQQFGFDNNNNQQFEFDNKKNQNNFGFKQQNQQQQNNNKNDDDFLKFGDDDFNLNNNDMKKNQQGFNFDNKQNNNNNFF